MTRVLPWGILDEKWKGRITQFVQSVINLRKGNENKIGPSNQAVSEINYVICVLKKNPRFNKTNN